MAYIRADASPNEVLQERVDALEQRLSSSYANDGAAALTGTQLTGVDMARGVTVELAGGTHVRADLVVVGVGTWSNTAAMATEPPIGCDSARAHSPGATAA